MNQKQRINAMSPKRAAELLRATSDVLVLMRGSIVWNGRPMRPVNFSKAFNTLAERACAE